MPSRDDERFVTVVVTRDPVEAEMMKDLLLQEGIEATATGTLHSSLLGRAGGIFLPIPIQVPASREEEAKDILSALEDYDAIVVNEEEGLELSPTELEHHEAQLDRLHAGKVRGEGAFRAGPSADEDKPRELPRQPRVAFFTAFLFPGGGHFNARATTTGFWLLGVFMLTAAAGLVSGEWRALVALPLLALADGLGALTAVARRNGDARGDLRETLFGWAPYAAMGGVALGVLVPFAIGRADPVTAAADDAALLCDITEQCSGGRDSKASCEASFETRLAGGILTPQDVERCRRCLERLECAAHGRECRACPPSLTLEY